VSRKRSRAAVSGGPQPLAEQEPLYARNPRGLFRPVVARGDWRPVWETKSFRTGVIVLLGVPLALVVIILIVVAILTALPH
jgi:hypothetical protein